MKGFVYASWLKYLINIELRIVANGYLPEISKERKKLQNAHKKNAEGKDYDERASQLMASSGCIKKRVVILLSLIDFFIKSA